MMITLTASDGHELECWMVEAEGDRKGGLVILQEIFGVTDQLKDVASQYSAQGYDVAVPALFDRQAKGTVIPFTDAPKGRDLMLASDLDATMMDAEAAVKALAAKGGKVAVMGFCWGGGLAIRAAQVLDIACAVSFYGTNLLAYLNASLAAPVQGHWGTQDSHAPADVLEKVKAYFPDLEVYAYEGAGHAFANAYRPDSYDQAASEQAHSRAAAFIAAHI